MSIKIAFLNISASEKFTAVERDLYSDQLYQNFTLKDTLVDISVSGGVSTINVSDLFTAQDVPLSHVPFYNLSVNEILNQVESKTALLPFLKMYVQDIIGSVESTGRKGISYLSKQDQAAVSENIDKYINPFYVTIEDKLTVQELVSTSAGALTISESDSLTIQEYLEKYQNPYVIFKFDQITAKDYQDSFLNKYFISETDQLNVSGSMSASRIGAFEISEVDKITIRESYIPGAWDNLTLKDVAIVSVQTASVYNVSIVEQFNISGLYSQKIPVIHINKSDSVVLADSKTTLIPQYSVNIYDALMTSEDLNKILLCVANLLDKTALSESVSLLLNPYFIDASSSFRTSESVSMQMAGTSNSSYEAIQLKDNVTVFVPKLLASMNDLSSLKDIIDLLLPIYTVNKHDKVTVEDSIQLAGSVTSTGNVYYTVWTINGVSILFRID